ncbi:MAG: GHKL domain-containing protein [Saprospiraceae bacterium]|nr:GHKL domain-containing protein [Saprospiraceae bacterium]
MVEINPHAKPANLLEQLSAFKQLQGIETAALEWLIDKAEYSVLAEGELFFEPGMKVDHMFMILEGEMGVRVRRGNVMKDFGSNKKGDITGVLPFSRMKSITAEGKVLRELHFLSLHRDHFVEMVNVSYALTQALVAIMSTRIRDFSQSRFQDEKLMALGKLSAGLAHELNNPASAMVRSSEELYKRIHSTPDKFKSVINMKITTAQTDQVNAILFSKMENLNTVDLSLMEREEQLDDLLDWLEDHNIEESDEVAETFVDFGIAEEDLEKLDEIMDGKELDPIIRWLESTLSLEKLIGEIRESADRISGLIKAVKGYSHMDRGSSMEPTDVRDGIRSTVMMLKFKIKQKGIILDKTFSDDLPKVKAFVSELNQVWTNLIANAVDAMDQGGELKIKAYQERSSVCVEVTDNGHGVPEEIQTRIFEPFFTTKSMDEGTGMGLDIVQKILNKHEASIDLDSVPGRTTFKVCIPILK